MAKYPVEISDGEGITDAVNYLLSGPSGLGQFFQGFSQYETAYLTGNFRPPFTNSSSVTTYVAPISLGTCEMLDERTWKYMFSSTQPSIPFVLGMTVIISGVTDPYYDGTYDQIGVVECTTTYVTLRTQGSYAVVSPSSGGTATTSITTSYATTIDDYKWNSTDCNAKVVVNSVTDRVFLSAQINNIISFTNTIASDLNYTVAINRYKGRIDPDPVNPDYRFVLEKTISLNMYRYFGLDVATGGSPIDNVETIFASVIDQPSPGYYWYILDISYNVVPDLTPTLGDLEVTNSQFGLRSLTAQVVKQ